VTDRHQPPPAWLLFLLLLGNPRSHHAAVGADPVREREKLWRWQAVQVADAVEDQEVGFQVVEVVERPQDLPRPLRQFPVIASSFPMV
jgi:hypothetical protein